MPEYNLIPNDDELQAIEDGLVQANEGLEYLISQLHSLTHGYAQVKAITQSFSAGDVSIVSDQMPLSETIKHLNEIANQIEDDTSQLDERVEDMLSVVDEPLAAFKENTDIITEKVEEIGEWTDTVISAVDDVLIDKAQLIKTSTEALTGLRQEKLNEGQVWLQEQVTVRIDDLVQSLLGDITQKLEHYTEDYRNTIGNANDHVDDINQTIENSVGKVTEQLDQVTEVLEAIKPALDAAEVILA